MKLNNYTHYIVHTIHIFSESLERNIDRLDESICKVMIRSLVSDLRVEFIAPLRLNISIDIYPELAGLYILIKGELERKIRKSI